MDQKTRIQYIKDNCPALASVLQTGPVPKATLPRQAPLPVHPQEGGELDAKLLFSGYPQDAIQIGEQDEEEAAKNATKVSFVIDRQDAAAILNLPLGKLTEEDLKPLERD